jgi:NADH-quinone oxidoreductase subunit G
MAGTEGAGLLEVPAGSNGRGLREAGVLPNAGPGLAVPAALAGASARGNGAGKAPRPSAARDARGIAAGLAGGELDALYLLHCDPTRELPGRELWERALASAGMVIAHAAFLTEGLRERADVVFPAESYAEKEGTVVHPDGRLQRLRPAIARPGAVRAGWQVIAELASRVGLDAGVDSGAAASRALFTAVPFYRDLTLEEIGGRGVRWQERAQAAAFPAPSAEGEELLREEALAPPGEDAAELAGYRSLWDVPEVEFSPALRFLFPRHEPRTPAVEVPST